MVANAAATCVDLGINPDGIPARLRARNRWLPRRGKAPVRYRSFHAARRQAVEENHDGMGYNLVATDHITVVDIDHCVEHGEHESVIAPGVEHLLRGAGTYAEYSANDGVHLVFGAAKPVDECIFWLEDPTPRRGERQRFKVEIWDRDRFVVLTGRTIPGLPTEVLHDQGRLDKIIAALGGDKSAARANGQWPAQPQASSTLADDAAVCRARNLPEPDGPAIARLLEHGGTRQDESADDYQLWKILGKVTQDVQQIKRIYAQSPLVREKVLHRAEYHIKRVLNDVARERLDEPESGDDGVPPCGDQVGELKRQLAAKTAECEQWKGSYALVLAMLLNLLRWKRAYACLRALLMTPALNESEKKVLVHHLSLHGVTFGLAMPTGVWWGFLNEEQMQASGVGEKSYRRANGILEDRGLFERERHEPSAPAPQSAHADEGADEQARSAGRPYDKWRPVPAGVERFTANLEAGQQPEPTPRQEGEREKRREKERKEKAAQEAREARLRQETAALRQVAYERDQAQREAEERRRALEEAQQVITVHQRSETLACHGCGVKIDPEQWRCDECRQREREQAAGHLPADGNGHELVGDGTALEAFPRVLPGGGGLVVDVTNNSAGGEEAERRTLWPPGDPDAPAAGASELFAAPAPCPTGGRCSDCKQPIAKAYGRCAYCRGAEYLRFGLEESP